MDGEKWVELSERPGYLGKRRDAYFALLNEKYGVGNWKFAWSLRRYPTASVEGKDWVDFGGMCQLYEDAYFYFLNSYPFWLNELLREAYDVYDDEESNVKSGLDYTIQETNRTHIQDIAIRNVVNRMGRKFHGAKLIQIRQELGSHRLSKVLSPGRVPFHRPEIIRDGEHYNSDPDSKPDWWTPGRVEDFYQRNRSTLVKR